MGEERAPLVRVAQGALRGRRVAGPRGAFLCFRGVPYARPPVGPLRFQVAQHLEPWNGVRDALKDGSSCPQIEWIIGFPYRGDEDCLYLNISTPKLPSPTEEVRYPVMAWIHGGGFEVGSGETNICGPEYLVGEGVVLVTMNYRVGVFGFLSLEDEAHPDNLGLKDQVAALRWINENIAAFGGDPNNVTIFGESAGGASVHYHMLSPMSKGLFHKAIMQSGCALNPWATAHKPRETAFMIAKELGSSATSTKEVLEVLHSAAARDLVEKYEKIKRMQPGARRPRFGPVPELRIKQGEEVFLPSHPNIMMQRGNFHSVPCIVGMNSHEGIILLSVSGILKNPKLLRNMGERLHSHMPKDLTVKGNPMDINNELKRFYFKNEDLTEASLGEYIDFASDALFTRGIDRTVEMLAANSCPVYYYLFAFNGKLNIYKELVKCTNLPGASHLDEVGYLFGITFFNVPDVEHGSPASVTRDRMVKMWTNFAKKGNPTPSAQAAINMYWPCYTSNKPAYLIIDEKLSVRKDLYKERIEFWKKLQKKIDNEIE